MIDKNTKAQALWFISQEMERIVRDLEAGVINRDQAIGSYNTVFGLASGIEDVRYMKTICRIISHLRSTNNFFNIKKLYLSNYFAEEQVTVENKEKEIAFK
ncbi:hypothetical protein [Paenibacillus sedimenti]|uniref:Uncharacterized protein n=1 Tax=Paenibacillus sedimenti TaxID=2770274 RepID=A0A926KQ46_9BACL|nr:hypothetical protein [Paenibacillus sedimenti]MBD0381427.1 hypothetical protein [Paenibacillus sedimenti]